MDQLEAVRIAAINLDRARDEEFHADQAWQRAKVRLLNAEVDHKAALAAVHQDVTGANGPRRRLHSWPTGVNDDALEKERLQQTS